MGELLATACTDVSPESTFVVISPQRAESLRFADVWDRALRVAAGLRSLGVGPGTRVAMQLPNWLEACLTYHACCALGAPLVPILHLLTPDEVLKVVDDSRAEVVVLADRWFGLDYAPTTRTLLERSRRLRHVIVAGSTPGGDDPRVSSFEELLGHAPLPDADLFPDPGAPSLIAYSSGATGLPKGVVHSQDTIVAATDAMVAGFGGADPSGEVGMNPNPVGHGTGLFVTMVLPFLHSFRSMLLLDHWNPDEMLRLMVAHRVTIVGGAPVFLQAMLRGGRAHAHDTTSLRAFFLGGDVVPPAVVEEADAVGWAAVPAYGLTEHPNVAINRPDDPVEVRAHRAGRVVPLTDVRIRAEDGTDVAPGTVGQIWVRGPGQCIGLLSDGIVTPATDDGWLATGDLGVQDETGRLAIRGRVKDVIIRGGEKVLSSEVEAVLLQHGDVIDVAVAGVGHHFGGQQVTAFVVGRRGAHPSFEVLARHCVDAGLARHKVPKRVRIVEAIPRTLLGKTQRHLLIAEHFPDREAG